jgi:putative YhdH/YhfP family quinone oxidoreductase
VSFEAFVVTKDGDSVPAAVQRLDDDALVDGDVVIDVAWSAVNYKDAMVTQPGNRVARISPLVPGVDLAGTVAASDDPAIAVGTEVLAQGYDLGVSHHGGFAARARVPAGWVVPLPSTLSARDAMVIGTAGFTAVLSLARLAQVGVTPADGPIVVTGATGGVGSMAVSLLARHGFEVVASSGKASEHDYLRGLGASRVIGREDLTSDGGRVLGEPQWAGAIDCVGGAALAGLLRSTRYGGAVVATGLTGGPTLETTVYPFIVRHVALLGVDTVATPIDERRARWSEMATHFPAATLEAFVAREVGLGQLAETLAAILAGQARGRTLVRLGG